MPQFDYTMPTLLLGQIGNADPRTIHSYANELLAQISDITFAGNGAGTYTVEVADVGRNNVIVGTFVAGAPDAITVIIDGLIASFIENGLLSEANMVNSDPDLDFNFLNTGIDYTITLLSNPGGVMSVATTQAAGGTNVGLGLCVAQSAEGDLVARVPTADTDDLLGVVHRNIDVETNVGGSGVTEYEPGDTFSVMKQGEVVVFATTAVAAQGDVFVRHAAGTPAAPLGSMSATDDAETVQLPGAKFKTATTGPGLVRVTLNIPG
jgi:hypothetical protein